MLRSRNISSIVAKRHNISLEKNYPPLPREHDLSSPWVRLSVLKPSPPPADE